MLPERIKILNTLSRSRNLSMIFGEAVEARKVQIISGSSYSWLYGRALEARVREFESLHLDTK